MEIVFFSSIERGTRVETIVPGCRLSIAQQTKNRFRSATMISFHPFDSWRFLLRSSRCFRPINAVFSMRHCKQRGFFRKKRHSIVHLTESINLAAITHWKFWRIVSLYPIPYASFHVISVPILFSNYIPCFQHSVSSIIKWHSNKKWAKVLS